jgi:hypothetical protein
MLQFKHISKAIVDVINNPVMSNQVKLDAVREGLRQLEELNDIHWKQLTKHSKE